MVVFEQNHVKQADTVVHTAAKQHRLFLQITQSRCRLTCVEHVATGVLNQALILMRRGRDTRHTLHDVEHRALDLQQTQLLAIDLKGHIARLHMSAILEELLYLTFRIEIVDDFFRYLHASKHTGVLDDELLTTHLRRRNTTERGVVTVADILFKPNSNKLTKFLFIHEFNDFRCKSSKKFAYMQKKVYFCTVKSKICILIAFFCMASVAVAETKWDHLDQRNEIRIGWGDQLFESLKWHNPTSIVTNLPASWNQTYHENYRHHQHIWLEYQWRFTHWFSLGGMFDMSEVGWDDVKRDGTGAVLNIDKNHYFYNLVIMPTVRFTYYLTEPFF